MARHSRRRFCKEEAPRPRPCPSSSVLSATPAKRVRIRVDEEESSQRASLVRLPQRSMEEVGSSPARGRKLYTCAMAKLANSSNARHGEAGFLTSTQRKKQSTCIEVSADSFGDDSSKRVVVVLISSGDDSGNNSGDDPNNNSGDDSDNNSGNDSEDHEASSGTIKHDFSLYLHIFTDQLF
jgi:hypothetical protein